MISARQVLAAFGAAALLAAAPGCSYGRDGASFGADADRPTPFEFFRGARIFLPVQVNGRTVQAMLDSGAGIVTMDRAYAAELGIVPTGTLPLTGAGGTLPAQIADVTLTVGGLRMEHVRVAIIDLSPVAAGLGRPMPLVLGRDAFEAAVVDIDFPGRKIAFHDPARFTAPGGAVRLPLTETPDRVREISVSVEGAPPERATFDLGSATPITVSHDYASRHDLLQGRPAAQAMAGGVGGMSVHDLITIRSLSVGGVELKAAPALINRSDAELPTKGLNVGMPVLSRFRVITDYGHDALFLVPNATEVAKPFRKDRAGLGAMLTGDHLNVVFVAPGGPADRAGWRKSVV